MLTLRARYCSTPLNAFVSLALFGIILFMLVRAFDWAVLDGVWNAGSVTECQRAAGGACWAVLPARFRLILFGLYPFDQQWRPSLACMVMLLTCIGSCVPALWQPRRLAVLWLAAYVTFLGLMAGGFLGMPVVITDDWGGLALTFLLFSSAMILGMPLALLLALCRRSRFMVLRLTAGGVIDFLRSIPLMAVLFAVAIVLPVMLPNASGDKLVRVILGFTLFFASYQAENFRGGLQAVAKGQVEAAISLGMKYWQYHLKIILPQVFRIVLPQTMNQVVSCFKDTSYVALVGFFDMTASASAALGTGQWALAFVEVYLVVGLIYFGFCYSLSQYGSYLERRADVAYLR
ncbi:MAG: amino acid ABC transporter permease [Acidisphaera sp.]|nr:amino acid ABC transporter permease [Acidisphaera sp.]